MDVPKKDRSRKAKKIWADRSSEERSRIARKREIEKKRRKELLEVEDV